MAAGHDALVRYGVMLQNALGDEAATILYRKLQVRPRPDDVIDRHGLLTVPASRRRSLRGRPGDLRSDCDGRQTVPRQAAADLLMLVENSAVAFFEGCRICCGAGFQDPAVLEDCT